jgi:ATP-dependent DNA helicase RecG
VDGCLIERGYDMTIEDIQKSTEFQTLIAECTAYDYKESLEEKKPKSWLKSVSAFANTLGGSLFFGVDNDGNVKGQDDIQHVTETISMKIRDYMDPLPDVEMIPLEQEGKHVLQLKVKKACTLRIIMWVTVSGWPL